MYIQKRHKAKQEKNKKQRRKLITKKRELSNNGRESLDVSPQALEQS